MMGNIGPMQLLIIFLIVLLIFGTKKLRNVGGDLGSAIRDFRKGMSNEDGERRPDAAEDATGERPDDAAADKKTEQATSANSSEADIDQPKS